MTEDSEDPDEEYGPWSPHTPSVQPYDLEFDEETMKSVPGPHIAPELDDYPIILLQSDHTHPCSLKPQTIRITNLLSDWHPDTSLHRAVYSGIARKDGQKIEVAVKFSASVDEALVEAANYGLLEALQGTMIPRLYGVLFGFEKSSDDQVACLVMERFGSKLRLQLHQLDAVSRCVTNSSNVFGSLTETFPRRGKILNCLRDIHYAGLSHVDFAKRNVVTKDDEFRIIDLADMEPHEGPCNWNMDFVENARRHFSFSEQSDCAIMCPTLFGAANEALYWEAGSSVLIIFTQLMSS